MDIHEEELEDYVYNTWLKNEELYNPKYMTKYRQFDITPYGIIDILVVDHDPACICCNIYELKAVSLQLDNLVQLYRYHQGIEDVLSTVTSHRVEIELNLICPAIGTNRDMVYFLQNQEGVTIWEYKLDIKTGISIDMFAGNYHLVDYEEMVTDKCKQELRKLSKLQEKTEKDFEKYQKQHNKPKDNKSK